MYPVYDIGMGHREQSPKIILACLRVYGPGFLSSFLGFFLVLMQTRGVIEFGLSTQALQELVQG